MKSICLKDRNGTIQDSIQFVGGRFTAGSYVLRIRVKKTLTIPFGRFKRGKLICVEAGEYAYIGSALATQGATCLARRLLRHATRTGSKPHPIRDALVSEFQRWGQCVPLPSEKSLHWHVDYLLDQSSAELLAVYVIRSPLRLEAALGRLMMSDKAAKILAPGLGATDVPGNSHLLRIEATEKWWPKLPRRLKAFLRQRVKLVNMHPRRSKAIERKLIAGTSFSAAEKATQHVFDTVGWCEVVSRLARASGMVGGIVQAIIDGTIDSADDAFREAVKDLARKIDREAWQLRKILPKTGRRRPNATITARSRPYPSMARIGSTFALGQLRAALRFVAKCQRDAPKIDSRGAATLTPQQRGKIESQIQQIRQAIERLAIDVAE